MKTEESIRSIFKEETRYTTGQLRHTKRKHATQLKYYKHISSGPIKTALSRTGLLPLFLEFLNQYNWTKGNFCLGQRRIKRDWNIGHKTANKFFLCLYYLEVIKPFGFWEKDRGQGTIRTPLWILTDKLFKVKPEIIYKWTEKLHFRCARFTH